MARGSSLVAYAITRLFIAIPMLLILLTFVFVILRILPGDPVLALWSGRPPPPSSSARLPLARRAAKELMDAVVVKP